MPRMTPDTLEHIRRAASDKSAVAGLTHRFYRYPARFSPAFVASAIENFSNPGDLVLDPYMGGGTTIVEAMTRGRVPVGCDLNSLAIFVANAKTTALRAEDHALVQGWAQNISRLSYHTVTEGLAELVCPERTRNLNLPRARPVKKLLAQCILSLEELPNAESKNFARCVLLNVAQWALNNRKAAPCLSDVRSRIARTTSEMLGGLGELSRKLDTLATRHGPTLIHDTAANLPTRAPFANGARADLVVTSPPYPGIHILYHRWQVDGRKETPAPYWIASCMDGEGSSFYNFGDRRQGSEDYYFEQSLVTLKAIRSVMKLGGTVVQLIAFSKPRSQLSRYLANMQTAGFTELQLDPQPNSRRIWREVPSRAWYAMLKGRTSSSREVVLVHRAS